MVYTNQAKLCKTLCPTSQSKNLSVKDEKYQLFIIRLLRP